MSKGVQRKVKCVFSFSAYVKCQQIFGNLFFSEFSVYKRVITNSLVPSIVYIFKCRERDIKKMVKEFFWYNLVFLFGNFRMGPSFLPAIIP